MIHLVIPGKPATAGSKRGFPIHRKDGTTGVAMVHDNKRFKPFAAEVKAAALEAANGTFFDEGPVYFGLIVVRVRPKSHYRTGRHSGELKPSAPQWPTTKPDNTKHRRAVEDALTGVLWRDDSQIVAGFDCKMFGEPERCEVFVSRGSFEVWQGMTALIDLVGGELV